MALWCLGILCFSVVFVPRFFTFMNFGYGFSDLGLYSQFLTGISQNHFNPPILTFGKNFLTLKPEPIVYLFYPLIQLTRSPSTFLFFDAFCMIIAAGVCANVAWRKLNNLRFVDGIFFIILFCPLTLESLHAPSRMTVWAQAPLALLMAEYSLQRRPMWLASLFALLCLFNLSFGALAFVLVPLLVATRMKRWNLRRRLRCACPIGLIGFVSLIFLKLTGNSFVLEYDLFWQTLGESITLWFILFWFLPALSIDILIVAGFLLCLKIPGSPHDPSLIAPLGAIAAINSLELLALKQKWIKRTLAAGLVATAVYFNLISPDPFFSPWKPEHYRLLTANKGIHDMIAKIPPDASVVAIDSLSVHLTQHLNMATLGSWSVRDMNPDYVLTRYEPTPFDHDRHYQQVEINSETGARLLRRIK